MKVVVKHNQTIWDIAVQYTGDSGNAMTILQANDKNATSLSVGEIITIPEQIFSNKTNVFFHNRDVATNDSSIENEPQENSLITQDDEFMVTQNNEWIEFN